MHAPKVSAAIDFDATTTVETANTKAKFALETRVHVWVDGERARVEYRPGSKSPAPTGRVLLTSDGARTIHRFDPDAESCGRWPMDGQDQTTGGFINPALGTPSNLTVNKAIDERGPKMLGFGTRHIGYLITYDSRVTQGDHLPDRHHTLTEEFFIATSLKDPGFSIWLSGTPHTGDRDLDRNISATMEAPSGALLKRVTTATIEAAGRTQTGSTVLEVTRIGRKAAPAQIFDAPFTCKRDDPADRS